MVMLPLLALMPLLHAHPLDAVGGDHPSGVHFPSAPGQGGVKASASPEHGKARDTGKLATIVVQEARQGSERRRVALERAGFVCRLPAAVAIVDAIGHVAPGTHFGRPPPRVHAHPLQAPPAGVAAAA